MLRLFLSAAMVSCTLSVALAQQADKDAILAEDVDSILDDLDRRLSDQENQVLTFDEQRLFEAGEEASRKPSQSLQFKTKTINASSNVAEELKRLSNAVLELDDDINELDSSVQVTKQKVLEAASIDNVVTIEGQLEGENAMALRNLVVKLDGYVIYELDETNGLWLPSRQIPFYSGPLPPGTHKVEVEGRIMQKTANHMPLNASGYTSIRLSRDISIPDGMGRQQVVLDLAPEKG